jgi:hypothetical protein
MTRIILHPCRCPQDYCFDTYGILARSRARNRHACSEKLSFVHCNDNEGVQVGPSSTTSS